MSINWRWEEKCGEVTLLQGDKEFTLSLYQGNAYMIFIHEFTDSEGNDMYNLFSFWADKTHAKKCLGIQKNGDGEKINMYASDGGKFTKFRFDKSKCRDLSEIVGLIAKAFDNIDIEIYKGEG